MFRILSPFEGDFIHTTFRERERERQRDRQRERRKSGGISHTPHPHTYDSPFFPQISKFKNQFRKKNSQTQRERERETDRERRHLTHTSSSHI